MFIYDAKDILTVVLLLPFVLVGLFWAIEIIIDKVKSSIRKE